MGNPSARGRANDVGVNDPAEPAEPVQGPSVPLPRHFSEYSPAEPAELGSIPVRKTMEAYGAAIGTGSFARALIRRSPVLLRMIHGNQTGYRESMVGAEWGWPLACNGFTRFSGGSATVVDDPPMHITVHD